MQIINSLYELNIHEKTSIALGNFDGLHVGHRKIMEDAISSAKEVIVGCGKERDRDGAIKTLCFTFSNHPFNFIMKRTDNDPHAVKLICSEDEKIRLIEEMGFDILVNVPFDEHIMTMKAEDFFNDIILGKLNAGCVSVGFNYSYGARAGGNSQTLKKECEDAGIRVNIHDAVRVENKIVSSTLIREMISIGNMELTAIYLGRAYAFRGAVTHGKKLGTAMGIPTVNIPVPGDIMLPPNGVYFSRIELDGREYKSVSNLGVRPTVSETRSAQAANEQMPKTIETNIFDFDDNAYGKEVVIYFDHFSRGEVRFDNKEELFAQIAADCEKAKAYHFG